jgi:hypothetical protein
MKRRISLAVALLLLGMAGADAAVTSSLLIPNQTLKCGDRVYSKNGLFFLVMQSDGNLVFYRKKNKENRPLFAARTADRLLQNVAGVGSCTNTAVMQTDGNLVVYSSDKNKSGKKTALWSSGTAGHKGAFLYVQNDGNFVIYDGKKPLWTSSTATAGGVSRGGGGGGSVAWNPKDGTGVTRADYLAWSKVNVCEEGGNWHVSGAKYSGGLGISETNWAAYGGQARYGSEATATPDQQIATAKRIQSYAPDQDGCDPGGW